MSSLKEQRKKLFQDKLEELGNMGVRERSEADAPFYDKPISPMKPAKQEGGTAEPTSKQVVTSELTFTDYSALYLTASRSKGAKSGFTIRAEVLQTLRHVLSDLRAETTLSSYIEHILIAHLRTHQELLNKEILKRKKEQTIQL